MKSLLALALLMAAAALDPRPASAAVSAYSCEVTAQAKPGAQAVQADSSRRFLFSKDFENRVILTGYVMDEAYLQLRVADDGALVGAVLDKGRAYFVRGSLRDGGAYETPRFSGEVRCGAAFETPYALRHYDDFYVVPGRDRESLGLTIDRGSAWLNSFCFIGDERAAAADLGRRMGVPAEARDRDLITWPYESFRWTGPCRLEFDRCVNTGDRVAVTSEVRMSRCR